MGQADRAKLLSVFNSRKKRGLSPVAGYLRRTLKLTRKCSTRTVQRELKLKGNKFRLRARKGQLRNEDYPLRVAHARKHLRYDFHKVDCWTDCHFVPMPLLETPKRSAKAWMKQNERFEWWATKAPSNFKGPGCKFFGGYGHGKGIFFVTYQQFNAPTAIQIFKRHALPKLRKIAGGRKLVIQFDGDGAFRSTLWHNFLAEEKIAAYHHPPRSADIAPIEKVWSHLNKLVEIACADSRRWRIGVKPTEKNKEDWNKFVMKLIRKVPRSLYRHLTAGMRGRMGKVITASGGRIKG